MRTIFVPIPEPRAKRAMGFLWTASEDLMADDPRLARALERVADAIEDAIITIPDDKAGLLGEFERYLREQS